MKINEVTQPLYELTAIDPKAKIYKGMYLSPEQAQHNLELLKQGKVKMDFGDHLNAWIQDAANSATFGLADKAAAGIDSLFHGTKYKDELAKYQKGNQTYQNHPNAANVKIPDNVPLIGGSHITGGDLFGLLDAGFFGAGAKAAAKAGGGKVAQTAAGIGTGVVAPIAAAHATNVKPDNNDDDFKLGDPDDDDFKLGDPDNGTVKEDLARIIKLSK
jgi:hypothetical protein